MIFPSRDAAHILGDEHIHILSDEFLHPGRSTKHVRVMSEGLQECLDNGWIIITHTHSVVEITNYTEYVYTIAMTFKGLWIYKLLMDRENQEMPILIKRPDGRRFILNHTKNTITST